MFTALISSLPLRILLAFLVSFIVAIVIGPRVIANLKLRQIGQTIRDEGVQEHKKKAGIPTMGGVIILLPALIAIGFWAVPNPLVVVAVIAMLGNGFIGLLDDLTKVIKARSLGLSPRQKLAGQIAIGLFVGFVMRYWSAVPATLPLPVTAGGGTVPLSLASTQIPFVGPIDLSFLYLPFVAFVIVGSSNAVNLTDGLDGLAGSTSTCAFAAMLAMACISSSTDLARLFGAAAIVGSGELAVLCAAIVGGCLGFLWFNANPAQVFMGDTGSLALGGAFGAIGVCLRAEAFLAIVGGIFVAEALSVILQVSYFKYTKGKRIFRMSPIHHHFELGGWPEQKVVARFAITALVLAIVGVAFYGRGLLFG